MSTETLELSVAVDVTIDDDLAPSDLFTRAQTEEFRRSLYDLPGRRGVLDHWAWNAVANGVRDVNRLDGWADLPRGVVTFRVAQ